MKVEQLTQSFLVLYFSIFSSTTSIFIIEATTLCNYTDDDTMYSSNENSNIVISRLKYDFAIISECFYENYMVLNPDKCHFLALGFNKPFPAFSYKNTIIKNVTEKKVFGILIDSNLNFKSHMKKICEKANQKLSALANFKVNNSYSEKKINKFFYQFTIYLLSFDMDVFFKGML